MSNRKAIRSLLSFAILFVAGTSFFLTVLFPSLQTNSGQEKETITESQKAFAVPTPVDFNQISTFETVADKSFATEGANTTQPVNSIANGNKPTKLRKPALTKEQWQKAQDWFYAQRAFPAKTTPPGSAAIAFQQRAAIPVADTKTAQRQIATQTAWSALGPTSTQVDDEYNPPSPYDKVSGRVTALAYHAASNTLLAGSAGGGVWKTTDGGLNWLPLSDNQPSLAIGALAIHPSDSQTIYAGTGEPNNSLDSYQSVGILKTTDGGQTWTVLGQTVFGGNNGVHIAKIIVHPTTPSTLLVAADNGLWLSTDAGANWSRKLGDSSSSITDVLLDNSTNPATVYAAWGNPTGNSNNGVYKSSDGGNTFTSLVNAPKGTNLGRLALAQAKQVVGSEASKRLYLVAAAPGSPTLARGTSLGMWRSSDSGTAWTQVTSGFSQGGPDLFGDNAGFGIQHGDYAMVVAVDPFNAERVYVGGINLFRTTDGGNTFTDATQVYVTTATTSHPDQHAIAFYGSSSPAAFYLSNDGGIYNSTDGGDSWSAKNGNLAITQFYAGATTTNFGTNPLVWAGAQGNGTQKYANSPLWTQYLSGDGGYTVLDSANPNTVYATWPFLNIYKTTDGGTNWETKNSGLGGNQRLFVAPLVIDSLNSQRLLAGTDFLFESTDAGNSWHALSSTSLAANSSGQMGAISAIALARSDSNTIYVGTGDGKLWQSTLVNGNRTWQDRSANTPGRFVTSIAVNPTNSLDVVATFSGFTTSGSNSTHIYRSTDGGATWTNISGSLPNSPVNSVLRHPTNGNVLYIGTDTGFYYTTDGGTQWFQYQVGLPNVVISQVFADSDFTTLLLATHGRGMFKLATSVLPVNPPTLQVAPTTLQFTAAAGGANPATQQLNLTTDASVGINWQATIDYGAGTSGWLAVTPLNGLVSAGAGNGATVAINATTGSLAVGTYTALIKFVDKAANPPNPVVVNVTFNITNSCNKYQVTLNTDNGSGTVCGTLSYALNQAKTDTQPVNITFAPNVTNLAINGQLPNVGNDNPAIPITIDGGCSVVNGRGVPTVRLNANTLYYAYAGLNLLSNVTVRGLIMTNFQVAFAINGNDNKVSCNWLGTIDGLTASPNNNGLIISNGDNNMLGETGKPESGNLISGNTGIGLIVQSGLNNQGYFNWIGYQKDGVTPLANGQQGVLVVVSGQIPFGQIYFYEDNRVNS